MSIPPKIHYCWFGGNRMTSLTQKCIASWKKYCPDYEIIEWNESNFDINTNVYIKQAYEAKKYAYVSDYVRLFVLFNNGGIYMDTDVEVLRPLDIFLENKAFSGFETPSSVPTGIMACEYHHPFIKLMLSYYDNRCFIKGDGTFDMTTNVTTITNLCLQNGLELNNLKQELNGFTLYPSEYFCPKDFESGKICITNKTFTIHHFAGSWVSKSKKLKNRIASIFGPGVTQFIKKVKG